MEGRRIAVRPDDLFAEILPFLQTTLPKVIEIELIVAPQTRAILGDPTQLHQVLLNLCVNARDSMPEGGRLTLSAEPAAVSPAGPRPHPDAMPGDYVRLEVADQGQGIPEEVRSRIFDPFFTTKEVGRGTGLGLSTARSIVKSHRGFITVDSSVGRGSTFAVMLPAAPVEVAQWTPDGSSDGSLGPGPYGTGQHILVVEDEESIRLIMRASLEHYGFVVTAVQTAPEAISLVAKDPKAFELAIVGLQLPGIQGGETILALRKLRPSLPMISSSGFATLKGQAQAESCGVAHFLDKPFSVETLLRTVNAALGRASP